MEKLMVRKWEEMERDCLVNIFRKLPLDDLILNIPFVCKSWSEASLDPLCWTSLDFKTLVFMPWTKLYERFSQRYPPSLYTFSCFLNYAIRRSRRLAVELRFPLLFGTSLEHLILASNECPRLKAVALPNLKLEDDAHLSELVGKWRELEVLEMESKPSSFVQLVAQIGGSCRKLKGLRMNGAIKKEDAIAIVNFLPMIKWLDLNRSYLPKEQLLLILNGCREMERLSARDCVGFQAGDGEILKRVAESGVGVFEDGGSKLVDEFDYQIDDCDPWHLCIL